MIPAKIPSSFTLALMDRVKRMKAAGEDIVSFAAGEPDFEPPIEVIQAGIEALKRGHIKYVSTPGIDLLRETVAKDYRDRLKASWVQAENVIAVTGAKQGIYLAFAAIVEPGQEILVPAPYWVSYPGIAKAAHATCVFVPTDESTAFFPTIDALNRAKTSKTRALVFSSPNNPMGTMIDRDQLVKIANWCTENKVYLIFDELYERISLDGKEHVCPLALGDEAASEYILSVNAASKSLAMTGWRIGYLVGHKKNIEALSALHGQMLTCLPSFVQEAAVAGFPVADRFLEPVIEAYRRRRNLVLDALKGVTNVKVVPPTGAFYAAIDCSMIVKKLSLPSDYELAEKILIDAKVAVIPGKSMGLPGWIRLSFATSDADVVEGMKRLVKFFRAHV